MSRPITSAKRSFLLFLLFFFSLIAMAVCRCMWQSLATRPRCQCMDLVSVQVSRHCHPLTLLLTASRQVQVCVYRGWILVGKLLFGDKSGKAEISHSKLFICTMVLSQDLSIAESYVLDLKGQV